MERTNCILVSSLLAAFLYSTLVGVIIGIVHLRGKVGNYLYGPEVGGGRSDGVLVETRHFSGSSTAHGVHPLRIGRTTATGINPWFYLFFLLAKTLAS